MTANVPMSSERGTLRPGSRISSAMYAAAFQPDRIHPTEATQQKLLDNVWPTLERMLTRR